MPKTLRISLSNPTFSSNNILKISPIAIAAHTFGKNVTVLKNDLFLNLSEFNIKARIIAKIKIKTTPVIQYTTVLEKDLMKSSSLKSIL